MKHWLVAFVASLAVNLVSMYVNYQSYQETHYLEWSYRRLGGEITVEFAPGWHAVHIYAMRQDDYDSHELNFSVLTLAVFWLAFALVGRAVLAVISTGEPWKDFLLLFVGWAALFYGGRAVMELWEDFM